MGPAGDGCGSEPVHARDPVPPCKPWHWLAPLASTWLWNPPSRKLVVVEESQRACICQREEFLQQEFLGKTFSEPFHNPAEPPSPAPRSSRSPALCQCSGASANGHPCKGAQWKLSHCLFSKTQSYFSYLNSRAFLKLRKTLPYPSPLTKFPRCPFQRESPRPETCPRQGAWGSRLFSMEAHVAVALLLYRLKF